MTDSPRKLMIATTVYGRPDTATITLAYHLAVNRVRSVIGPSFFTNADLVRSRSRAVRVCLESDCTDLLLWDEDVIPRDLQAINVMLESKKDVIGLQYPKKSLRLERTAAAVPDENEMPGQGRPDASDLESNALDWVATTTATEPTADGILPATWIGMGFTLIRRHVLEKMVDRYAHLGFDDMAGGVRFPTVALFNLILRDRVLYNEDQSFCLRWREMGGEIHVLTDPARHIGGYAYGSQLG